ncbi:MAG: ABC transporter permease [Chlorobaculum sp.]|nr:ABC transporter permease [Chlorobaculum sp.]
MKLNLNKLERITEGSLLPLAILLFWYLSTSLHVVRRDFIPAPVDVVAAFNETLHDGTFVLSLSTSVIRVLKGFLFGSVAGYLLGTLLGMSKTLEKIVTPLFNAIRQVPLPAWAPVLVLISNGEPAQIVFIAIGASYPVVLNTFEGITSVRKEYLEVASVYRFSRLKTYLKIFLPASLPSVLTGLRIAMSIAWMSVVAAEIFMASGGGIGEMMWAGRELSRMDIVFVCIAAISLVGFTMTALMRRLEQSYSLWRLTMKQSA